MNIQIGLTLDIGADVLMACMMAPAIFRWLQSLTQSRLS